MRSPSRPPRRSSLDLIGSRGDPFDATVLGHHDEAPRDDPSDLDLIGSGECSFDIVGESRYQANLGRLAGGKKARPADVKVIARLVHEDENPHDDQAVRVDVEGLTVGYLDRRNARRYRKRLVQSGRGGRDLRCRAVINGGWFRSQQEQGHFGVKLDLPWSDS